METMDQYVWPSFYFWQIEMATGRSGRGIPVPISVPDGKFYTFSVAIHVPQNFFLSVCLSGTGQIIIPTIYTLNVNNSNGVNLLGYLYIITNLPRDNNRSHDFLVSL